MPEEGTPEYDELVKKREEAKQLSTWWRNTTSLHAKLQRAQSDHATLKAMVENSKEWAWAKNSEPYRWVAQAHEEYKVERQTNEFYNEFLSAPPGEIRQRHGIKEIKKLMANGDKLTS